MVSRLVGTAPGRVSRTCSTELAPKTSCTADRTTAQSPQKPSANASESAPPRAPARHPAPQRDSHRVESSPNHVDRGVSQLNDRRVDRRTPRPPRSQLRGGRAHTALSTAGQVGSYPLDHELELGHWQVKLELEERVIRLSMPLSYGQQQEPVHRVMRYDSIHPGLVRRDAKGERIHAHDGAIFVDGGRRMAGQRLSQDRRVAWGPHALGFSSVRRFCETVARTRLRPACFAL